MWEIIKKIIIWFASSLENVSNGSSAKKWSSLAAVLISLKLSLLYTNTSVLSVVLTIWLTFALMCLAIVTGAQLIALKNGSSYKEKDK